MNVSPGDCAIIQHASKRVTMVDICDGNIEELVKKAFAEAREEVRSSGNFRMCESPTNPIKYAKNLGVKNIFRFILSHPDMDHMDGFNALLDEIGITNFWDSGARREKPDFSENSPYREVDWDRYERVRDGAEPGVTSLEKRAGAEFRFANKNEDETVGGDGLHILAPNNDLLNDPDETDDLNDASYVILYRSTGGRILLPGDAHDASWEYVMQKYPKSIANCSVLLAPHHGRDSDRDYTFLDKIRPLLTIIGCSPSEYIDYDQWHRRELPFITSNQCGNIVLEIDNGVIDVYVENRSFVEKKDLDVSITNSQGYYGLWRIPKIEQAD